MKPAHKPLREMAQYHEKLAKANRLDAIFFYGGLGLLAIAILVWGPWA